MTTTTHLITAEELLQMSDIGRCELIRGEIVKMAPAGDEHGRLAIRIGALIFIYVEQEQLGVTYAAETGFTIERKPDTVRAPDVAFIRQDRIGPSPIWGFREAAPDLVVEVLSPSDTHSEVRAKVEQWLAAGTISVWVADPRDKLIEIHRRDQVLVFRQGEEITGEPTLPGFVLKVDDVFVVARK